MERSDEARREDSLYDRLSQVRQTNRQQDKQIEELKAENKRLKRLCDQWAHMIDPHTDPGGCANCFHQEFLQALKETA